MKSTTLLLAVALLSVVAIPTVASPLVLYENDFTTRTSVGPIGGLTTSLPYQLAALVPTTQDAEGQDAWVRRHTGTKPITVVDPTVGNQYVAFSNLTSNHQHYGYAYQKIGSSVSEGVLRASVDILAPSNWTSATSAQTNVAFGGDLFYSFEEGHGENMASRFGFGPVGSGTSIYFAAFNGTNAVTSADVTGGNWYRFIADHDLHAQTYTVNVYDLGSSQPELGGVPASDPVATFNDLAFCGNSFDAITSMRLVSIRNNPNIGFDNIVIAKQDLSPHAYHVLGTQPAIYWRLNEPAGKNVAADASLPVQYNGAFVGTRTLATPGPRPADALYGMAPDNLAVGVTGNGAVRYTELNTTAGVGTGEYSLQMWFKSTASAWTDRRLQYLFGRGNSNADADRRDYVFIGGWSGSVGASHAGTGKLNFGNGSSGTYGDQVLNVDEWYHLTVVRNDNAEAGASKVQVYLNGELEIESMDSWQGGTGDWLTAGHRPDLSGAYGGLGLYGAFDEVVLWDRALSAAEVRASYVAGVPEPSAWILLVLGGLSVAVRRRRRLHSR